MFGALITCTDPIAIINVLRELPTSKKFNVLLEGESLLNDAIGMILYQIGSVSFYFLSISLRVGFSPFTKEQDTLSFTYFILFWGYFKFKPNKKPIFIDSLSLGGIILGLLSGILSSLLIQKLFNDEILVVNTTLMSSYIVFYKINHLFWYLNIGLFYCWRIELSGFSNLRDYGRYFMWTLHVGSRKNEDQYPFRLCCLYFLELFGLRFWNHHLLSGRTDRGGKRVERGEIHHCQWLL